MRTSLIDLLREHGVAHPTRIVRSEIARGMLRLEVEGWRWWEPAGGHGGGVALTFEGLSGGALDAALLASQAEDEALDNLDVRPLSDEPWAMTGTIHSTYCQAPLPDPLALHAAVHDFLLGFHAPVGPFDYLNGGPTLARFRTVVGGGNYLLGRAPGPLHAIVMGEVERQRVPHTVLVDRYPPTADLVVILGDATFTCKEAWAVWDVAAC